MAQAAILIVDDDPLARNVLKRILTSSALGGVYAITTAASGKEALEKAEQSAPDLILLDVMMPDMDGFEVCRILRSNPGLAEIPILLITALEDRESRLRGIEAGADDFISKPPNPEELLARVASIARLNRYRLLHAERARFEWVVSQTEEGYLLVNDLDEVIYANPRARLYLGLAPQAEETSLREPFLPLVTRQYRCEPQESWQNWPGGENELRYLVRPESETAQSFWLQVTRLEQNVGENTFRLIRLKDITQKMNAQRDVRSFRSALLHKFRTPLTAMVISIDLLAEESALLSEESQELLDVLVTSARSLKQEIDDVFDYIQAPKLAPLGNPQHSVSLARLIQLAEEVQGRLDFEHLDVTCAEDLLPLRVHLTEQGVEWILWEIFDNAKKFHPGKNPTVEIEFSLLDDGRISLVIQDNGIHLSPEQIQHAWTPFYQGEKDFTGNVAGMGLGLSVVSSLIWEAGGSCQITNRSGQPGVRVTLAIPILKT